MPDVMYDRGNGPLLWARMPTMALAVQQYEFAISRANASGANRVWVNEGEYYKWERPKQAETPEADPFNGKKTPHARS